MYDKYKSYYLDGVEIKPTFKLQMKSLELFAEWMGYRMNHVTLQFDLAHGYDYVSRRTVDFNNMVQWYNYDFVPALYKDFDVELKKSSERLGFDIIHMTHAVDTKLVKKVHLQRKKSKKIRGEYYTLPEIVLTSHIIKFA